MREVRRWLHLGHKGVIVMIRDAQLAQLRPLARMLTSIDASLLVTSDATRLADFPEGALVLLVVHPEDLGWLNLNRPILAQRSLRVVLWPTQKVGVRLKFESPDLHDWISHFVVCPPGVPDFAIEGLRVGWSWWPGVAWRGPGLDVALGKFGTAVTELRPDAEFEHLVSVLSTDRRAVVRWKGVDSQRMLWRVRWALAEARHEGFCILDQPSVSTPGWFPVDSRQSPPEWPLDWPFGLAHAIRLEFEPATVVPDVLRRVEKADIGLLLEAGPELRECHDSPEIEQWRRDLVRDIRREPERVWSRAQLAVFASLERDATSWPSWLGQLKQRHSTEHFLRTWTRHEPLPDTVALAAASIDDPELVSRWGSYEVLIRANKQLGRDIADASNLVDAADVQALGETLGWDSPDVIRATASEALALLDRPQHLRTFLDDVLKSAARWEIGWGDESLPRLLRIGAQALALAGDPHAAQHMLAASRVYGPDEAAIHVLLGQYSAAARMLERAAGSDVRELYAAALLASGQGDMNAGERDRELPSAAELAREFLRKCLVEQSQ